MPAALSWTQQEDDQLRELVALHGTKAWAKIAALIRTKGSKQCRRRWKNFLNMSAKTCSWSPEEDAILIDAHRRLGNRWTEISKIFGDRTDNAVKNRWHALTRKHPNLDQGGNDSDVAPRSTKRRRTRASAANGEDEDSGDLDSGRYGRSQYTSSSAGGISAAALPTPFDQRARGSAGSGSFGTGTAAAAQQVAAARFAAQQQAAAAQYAAQQQAAAQYAALQQQQQQQAFWAQQQQLQQGLGAPGQQAYGGQPVVAPLQIRVSKDFLSPWEQELADQINAMNLPVQVEVAAAPLLLPLPSAAIPPPDASLLPLGTLPDMSITNRASWRQYVEKLDEPGDSKGLQELLDWFSSNTSGTAAAGAPPREPKDLGLGFGSRRMTRSLSKGTSSSGRGTSISSGSGSLSSDHRQLLVKLMSRGLEVRASGDADAAGNGSHAAPGGAHPSPHGNGAQAPATAPRFDPMRRTRSSSGKSTMEREAAAAAAAAAVQQAGLAAKAAAAAAAAAAGLPAQGSGSGFKAPAPLPRGTLARGSRSRPPSVPMPHIEPAPLGPAFSDVLVAPTFTSQEIALLIETLKPKP